MWSTCHNDISVRCAECIKGNKACSFTATLWPIAAWPVLEQFEEGIAHQAKDARDKRKSVTIPAVAMGKSVSEGSGVGGPSAGTQSRKKGNSVMKDSPAEIPPAANPLVELEPAPGPVLGPSLTIGSPFSRFEGVTFEDLHRYDQLLRRPSRTPELMALAIADINAARRREANSISVLAKWVEDRAEIMDSLLAKMRFEAERLQNRDERRL